MRDRPAAGLELTTAVQVVGPFLMTNLPDDGALLRTTGRF